ncbi:LysE family transporter [Corynebacterium felinum]|uniref:L-lysine exporter family protein LysE/ArgO n=1 Tax=Corynebacterium felinum TaxID=131318 RepID=A0ABU2B8Z8_9CORY|nr:MULTISPECIES: LysE family transporter [Corynebacterium]MDF5821528.1 LysE family transporter [Corynebacterium felinum]MDO4760968.1 LysE family transporter [Corynebacterium sp.]MDR7355115.1 L-lysine exporter family protein LysE/ArgO [Corynebacterium felinum]WJY94466.1 Arginine exporter protein ArgO [Corynebacterium felinum]
MLSALVTGFTATLALIAAIGAQSSYVLRQGILREHAVLAASVCVIVDVLFIAVGVAGVGALIQSIPWLLTVFRILGAIYLLWLASHSFRRFYRPQTLGEMDPKLRRPAPQVLKDMLAITLLNPGMYVDLMLIAALANAFESNRWWYYVGGIGASATWFYGIATAGVLLTPLLRGRRAWQLLELFTGCVMVFVAWHLCLPLLTSH